MIFGDTGGWFAAYVPGAKDHASARAWLAANAEPMVITDYVFDELMTLLKARGEGHRAYAIGRGFLDGEIAIIERVSTHDFMAAWAVFDRYRDKDWSFTDCVSRVVIERLGITRAFAFDEHFRQFGNLTVLP